jgi:hypothetical protein
MQLVCTFNKGIDDWIEPQDKLPLFLAISLYNEPIEFLNGFTLIQKTSRVGVWQNEENDVIVGLRGTNPGGNDFLSDLLDDWTIATKRASCDLTILQNITIPENATSLTFAGHSLGGAAAMCMGNTYPTSRVVALNAGAPPTNPVLHGPGPERATHYHVMGDIISSHMSPQAARIVRIEKMDTPKWLTTYPHETNRMMQNDGPWRYVTVDEEQESWIQLGKRTPILAIRLIVCSNPIPGSTKRC